MGDWILSLSNLGVFPPKRAHKSRISGFFWFENISDDFTLVGQFGLWPIPPGVQILGSLKLLPQFPTEPQIITSLSVPLPPWECEEVGKVSVIENVSLIFPCVNHHLINLSKLERGLKGIDLSGNMFHQIYFTRFGDIFTKMWTWGQGQAEEQGCHSLKPSSESDCLGVSFSSLPTKGSLTLLCWGVLFVVLWSWAIPLTMFLNV